MTQIEFRYGKDLDLDRVLELYHASTLSESRPVEDRKILEDMIRNTSILVTAWEGDLMVGIARTLSDFSYVGYLADLAVRVSHQRSGIGTSLIEKTRERMGPQSILVLLAAPDAASYYPKVGFRHHHSAWVLKSGDPLGN